MKRASIEAIQKGFAEFGEKELVSKVSGVKKFMTYATVGIAVATMEKLINDNIESMRSLGIVDNDNTFDMERLRPIMVDAARRTGKFDALGFTLDDTDIDSLFKYISNY